MKEKRMKMPPVGFSNAMNILFEDWNFQDWEDSREWKLWCEGFNTAVQEHNDNKMKKREYKGRIGG